MRVLLIVGDRILKVLLLTFMLVVPVLNEAHAFPAGLVSLWSAEGNYLDVEGPNNGSPVGVIGFATGLAGQAFDANGGHVSIPDNPSLNTPTGFTVVAWIKFDSYTGYGSILNRRDASNIGGFVLEPVVGSPVMTFGIYDGGWHILSAPGWVLATWYHVAATYDGSTLVLYRDGAVVATLGHVGTVNNPATPLVAIGGNVVNGDTFDGLLDEVALFDRALSTAEIIDLASGTPVPVRDATWGALKGIWR